MAKTRQQLFTEVALQQRVLDASRLTRLLHAVPDPEDATDYLLQKQLISADQATSLKEAFLQAMADAPSGPRKQVANRPASPPELRAPNPPSKVPPRPSTNGSSNGSSNSTPTQSAKVVDEKDDFDALIDEILND